MRSNRNIDYFRNKNGRRVVSDQEESQPSLSERGSERRSFLRRTAFATAGTSAAVMFPAVSGAAPQASAGLPRNKCPDVKTPLKVVEGKVAFITGGDRGIGLGIAQAFADAGMKIAIGYRTQSHLDDAMKTLGLPNDRIHAVNVDVTDRPGMERAANETVDVFGKIHVLINNAGVLVNAPLSRASYDDWDWVMNVNLTSIFNGVRAFLPHIQSHGEGGQIATTSSVLGLIVSGEIGVYSTSKVAAVGMMEALRAELADMNIGASVICPGYVKTDLWDASRNRPSKFASTADTSLSPQKKDEIRAAVASPGAWAMDPVEVGRLVLRGIRNNDLYILTHPEFEQGIRDRSEALINSIPQDLHAPKERVAAEAGILRNPIYIAASDRKRCPQR
jgi:NAD(P)-dependent dehydrogenase (short-subunit alcohol dehydrogenase family)